MEAREVKSGDVLTIPALGMFMVRDVTILAPPEEFQDNFVRIITHVKLLCSAGRTDPGFWLTYPAFTELDIYRSEGTVEVVGNG